MELQSSELVVNGRNQSLDPGKTWFQLCISFLSLALSSLVSTVGGVDKSKGHTKEQPDEGKCHLLGTQGNGQCHGLYDRPLGCFGCGVGWFCFILGFVFPLLWYIATALYFGKYYRKDPRERAGLAASAIAALICSVAALITLIVVHL